MKYYAGIGSRMTPRSVQLEMEDIAGRLCELGYCLRSGGAPGADQAFERGLARQCEAAERDDSRLKQIFHAKDCEEWCLDEAQKHLPKGYPPIRKMREYVRKLIGRNMKQILGDDGHSPVRFVVCWTPNGKDEGGTGHAIRCAKAHDIPVYNLRNSDEKAEFYRRLTNLDCETDGGDDAGPEAEG